MMGLLEFTDRFFRMEYDVVDTSIVAGQLVNDAPAGRVPDVDVAIGRSSRNSVAISWPRTPKQILQEKKKKN